MLRNLINSRYVASLRDLPLHLVQYTPFKNFETKVTDLNGFMYNECCAWNNTVRSLIKLNATFTSRLPAGTAIS
jgi:hypothetical protein